MEKRPYIMVVDDDREILRMLKRTLELEGYGVVTSPDGRSALVLLEECKPDLVLLDIMMPVLDGYQVLALIRERSNVPVLMLTSRNEVASLDKALALGADDYVRKPFRPRELLARIKAKLRRADPQATASNYTENVTTLATIVTVSHDYSKKEGVNNERTE